MLAANGDHSRVYTGDRASDIEVDPATDAGMSIAAYQYQGGWREETADLVWKYYHPAGIATVSASGEKYKLRANTTWPIRANLESSLNGVKWAQELNQATPATANSWVAWSFSGEAVPSGSIYVRFRFNGSVNKGTANLANYEVNGCTIALTSGNVIQVAMNGEESNYQMTMRIANDVTSEWLEVEYPIALNKVLIIDTENMEVTYRGVNAIRAISDLSSIRTEWLKMLPGVANTLTYTAVPTGNVTIVVKHRSRSL